MEIQFSARGPDKYLTKVASELIGDFAGLTPETRNVLLWLLGHCNSLMTPVLLCIPGNRGIGISLNVHEAISDAGPMRLNDALISIGMAMAFSTCKGVLSGGHVIPEGDGAIIWLSDIRFDREAVPLIWKPEKIFRRWLVSHGGL